MPLVTSSLSQKMKLNKYSARIYAAKTGNEVNKDRLSSFACSKSEPRSTPTVLSLYDSIKRSSSKYSTIYYRTKNRLSNITS